MKKITIFGFIVILALVFTVPVQADKLSDANKQKAKIQDKIESVKQRKSEETRKLIAANAKKKSLADAQRAKNEEYNQILSQVKALNASIKEIDNAIKKAEDDYNKQQELLKTRLIIMYENSDTTYLQTLMESKNVMEFLEKIQLISLVSKSDKDLLDSISVMKKDIEVKKSMKLGEKKQKSDQAKSKIQDLQILSNSRADVEDNINQINSTLQQLEQQEDELVRQAEALNQVIKNLSSSKVKYSGGIMRWPVPCSSRISSAYGMRYHPILHKMKFHTGIDIPAPTGSSIVAANSGRIILAEYTTGYGNTVIIDHGGGIATLYGHCSRFCVRVGDKVKAGEVIAKVGSTGWSTGPHCHFEVRVNGATVNPQKYVRP